MTAQTIEKTQDKTTLRFRAKAAEAAGALRRRGRYLENRAGERDPLRRIRGMPPPGKEKMESAGRIGARQGKVSELTVIVPLKPGGAKRMRAFLELCMATSAIKAWTWLAPFTTCAGSSWITTRSCSSPARTTATGILTSTTSAPRSQTSSTSSSVKSKAGRGFVARSQRLHREAPDPGALLVRRQSEFDCGGDQAAREDRPGGRRIPRQGGLKTESEIPATETTIRQQFDR